MLSQPVNRLVCYNCPWRPPYSAQTTLPCCMLTAPVPSLLPGLPRPQVPPTVYMWPMVAFATAVLLNLLSMAMERRPVKRQLCFLNVYISGSAPLWPWVWARARRLPARHPQASSLGLLLVSHCCLYPPSCTAHPVGTCMGAFVQAWPLCLSSWLGSRLRLSTSMLRGDQSRSCGEQLPASIAAGGLLWATSRQRRAHAL